MLSIECANTTVPESRYVENRSRVTVSTLESNSGVVSRGSELTADCILIDTSVATCWAGFGHSTAASAGDEANQQAQTAAVMKLTQLHVFIGILPRRKAIAYRTKTLVITIPLSHPNVVYNKLFAL